MKAKTNEPCNPFHSCYNIVNKTTMTQLKRSTRSPLGMWTPYLIQNFKLNCQSVVQYHQITTLATLETGDNILNIYKETSITLDSKRAKQQRN